MGSHKGLISVLVLAAALWLGGCGDGPKISPAGEELANSLSRELALLTPVVVGPLKDKDLAAADAALQKVFTQRHAAGRTMTLGVVLLDDKGVEMAARYPDLNDPDGIADENPKNDYGSYEAVKKALKSKTVTKAVLHTDQWGRMLVACAPVPSQGPVLGIVVLVLAADDPLVGTTVSPEEFKDLDIKITGPAE